MKRLLITFLLCCFVATAHLHPNSTNYSFWTMDINKGLSHSNVTSILSDSKGMLWIGTAFGLNRYDRHEVKNYFHQEENPQSIAGNYIFFIAEAPTNTIWVSTVNGLSQYNPNRDHFTPAGKEPINVYSFHATDQAIWFGGEKKLYQYNYQEKILKELPLKDKERIPSRIVYIYSWTKDVLLLITRNTGIWEYDCRSGALRPSVYPTFQTNITAAYLDKKGFLYLSNYGEGLYIFDRSGKQIQHLTTRNSPLTYDLILDITERNGQLWLATDGGGINILTLEPSLTLSTIQHIPGDMNSLPGNSIGCLYQDKRQNIWAGSIRGGVTEIKETFIQTYKETIPGNVNGLTNQTVSCLCKDEQGYIWIGTDGGGVNRFDPTHQTFKHYPTTYNEKVVSIVDYSPSELLLSLYNNGIYRFNKTTEKYTPFIIVDASTNQKECYSGFLEQVYRASDDRFLFLGRTPYVYHRPTGKFTTLKYAEDPELLSSLKLVAVEGDTAYLQQGNYLLSANLQTDSLSLLFTYNKQEVVQVVERDANGLFWIGTNRGLRCLNLATKKCEEIQTNLFQRVSAVIAENNTIWIGAQNALFSYNVTNRKFAIWQESDGYSPNELSNIYHLPSTDPYLYIGGSHGLVRIRKSINSAGTVAPEIRLVDMILDGLSLWEQLAEERPHERSISIPWNYKSLQVKIIALEQDIFKSRLFRYTLFKYTPGGGESKVIETYSPTFSMDLLAPGEYTLQASCYTDNGDWSTPQQLLQIKVRPSWYTDYRLILPLTVFLLVLILWQIFAFIRRREQKLKWKMSEVVQQTNQEKIQFLINISHELRTPLTLIYAPLKKVIEKIETEIIRPEEWKNIRNQLTNIHKSANQMKDIINMTLDINRISDEENALHKEPHALNEWICSVAEEFKYEFESKQISLRYALDESIETVVFDDHKCESVLSNMLMNAFKFTPEGSQIILASAHTHGGVRISVSDQGTGFGDLDPQKLFTRFYQGEHNQGGSGIGLSYAKTLIKKHGGTIGAFNNPECGATFYFELPQTDVETILSSLSSNETFTSFPTPEEELLAAGAFSTKPYTVVVVEDNKELRHFLVESLQADFKTVYPAANGQEGWTIVTQRMPDIVISDIMMPIMDGYELCRKIKTENLTCHIPVILLTARGDRESVSAGYKLGADAYLPKPFELELLQVMLRNQLRSHEMMKLRYREALLRTTDDAPTQNIANADEEFLLRFQKLVITHLSSNELNVQFLTEQMGMSRSPLYAKLKALTNMGVNDYINRMRIEKASELLRHSPEKTIADISSEVGFEYQRYFSTLFKQIKGITPTQFRQQKED